MNTYQELKFAPEKRPRKGAWLKCKTCNKEFYVFPKRLHTCNPSYCSQKCYKKTGVNNPNFGKKWSNIRKSEWLSSPNRPRFKTGENNPNFIRFGRVSGFFGRTNSWFRKYLLENVGKCTICGFSDKRILEIHHKDKNRKNITMDNIILLCQNCHALEHWNDNSGKYKWKITGNPHKQSILDTPRNYHGRWTK